MTYKVRITMQPRDETNKILVTQIILFDCDTLPTHLTGPIVCATAVDNNTSERFKYAKAFRDEVIGLDSHTYRDWDNDKWESDQE